MPRARGDRCQATATDCKGVPGTDLLAHVITSNYGDHTPLYRQEDILARYGVTFSRATLSGWMAHVAERLTPLYDLMAQRVRASMVIHTDDTTVPVCCPTLPKTRTVFLVYVGDDQNPFCVYDFTARTTRDGLETLLERFSGYL